MKYVLGAVLVLLLAVRLISIVARSRSTATSPGGIAHALTTRGRHVVTIPANRFVWNPSLPVGADNRVPGPGTATYTYAEGGVALDFVPATGEARRYSGPLPADLTTPDTAPSLAASLLAPAVAVLAAAVALLVAGGSPGDHVTLASLIGIAGWVVTSGVVMATNQVIRTQAFAAGRAH